MAIDPPPRARASQRGDAGVEVVVLDAGDDEIRRQADHQIVMAERVMVERGRLDVVRNWERRRRGLLRALHDRAQQQLLGLRMELLRPGAVEARAVAGNESVRELVDDTAAARRVGEIISEIERLAQGLPPSALRMDDMAAALREIAGQSGIPVEVHLPAVLPTSLVVAELLTYVAGEALANVLRHSAAGRCTLTVRTVDDDVVLVVHDAGPALDAIAQEIEGHGIAELRSRARLLGGTLNVQTSDGGTTITLVVPNDPWDDAPTPHDFDDRVPTWTWDSRDEIRGELNDDTAEIGYRVDADWVDERGQPISFDPSAAVQIVDAHGVVAAVHSSRDRRRVVDACIHLAPVVIRGRQRADTAVALRGVWNERNQVARRAAAIEESLGRRLTTRPVKILTQASDAITRLHDRAAAADLLLQATAAVREIVSVLSSDQSQVDRPTESGDPFLFGLLGQEFGVEVATSIEQIPSGAPREAIAAMGERIVVDASPGSRMSFRVSEGGGRATLLANLETLPSPRAIAFIEDTVLWQSGLLTCELRRDRVRLQVVLPCASS